MICQKLSSAHIAYLSRDILPKNNIYTMIYREMGTFLPLLTPGFAQIFLKVRYILVIYQKLSSVYLTYLSCDILPKNNIYIVIYREMGTF